MALGTGTLVDTNIFLEILLNQDRKQECKSYLRDNSESLFISDFSLHSIGVILFKSGKQNIFSDFCEDLLNNVILSTLPQNQYETLPETSERYGLDFDDSYQLLLAQSRDFKITTMDQDFRSADPEIVYFL